MSTICSFAHGSCVASAIFVYVFLPAVHLNYKFAVPAAQEPERWRHILQNKLNAKCRGLRVKEVIAEIGWLTCLVATRMHACTYTAPAFVW